MKKMFILGMTVLILSLTVVGCGGEDNENTDPKTISFTGITSEMVAYAADGWILGVFQTGTTLAQVKGDAIIFLAETGQFSNRIIAGASDDDPHVLTASAPHTLTVALKSASSGFDNSWTGSGTFDIYFISVDLPTENPNSKYYIYKMAGISITSATTTVSASATVTESALVSSLF